MIPKYKNIVANFSLYVAAWLRVMSKRAAQLRGGWAGIVLTGWQRYDHFAVLCELLPASIPSLAINLLLLSSGGLHASLAHTFYSALGCEARQGQTVRSVRESPDLTGCSWPGHKAGRHILTNIMQRHHTSSESHMDCKNVSAVGRCTDWRGR